MESDLRLHSAAFTLEFRIDAPLQGAQLGCGFLLDWSTPLPSLGSAAPVGPGVRVGPGYPDWGFYGYLGSSTSAWSYDVSSGDLVFDTESVLTGLPRLAPDTANATLVMCAELPRDGNGQVTFALDGAPPSPPLVLPRGAVLIPAAVLLADGQQVSLGALVRTPLSHERVQQLQAQADRVRCPTGSRPDRDGQCSRHET